MTPSEMDSARQDSLERAAGCFEGDPPTSSAEPDDSRPLLITGDNPGPGCYEGAAGAPGEISALTLARELFAAVAEVCVDSKHAWQSRAVTEAEAIHVRARVEEVLASHWPATIDSGGVWYALRRDPDGLHVSVHERGAEYPLPHVVLHSPTGFECGFGGSGPADLALSLLAHHLDVVPEYVDELLGRRPPAADPDRDSFSLRRAAEGVIDATGKERAAIALRFHQEFKQFFVAQVRVDVGRAWILTASHIEAFLRERHVL